jgi:transcriptional regulator with XRE-family HTH domain
VPAAAAPGDARRLYDNVKLRAWRHEAGLRREQVCVAVGISSGWLERLETQPYSRPSLDLLTDLARFYGHEPAELLTGIAA